MDGLVGEAARLLLTQGGLIGALLVLSGALNVALYRAAGACNQARITDAREIATALERASATNATLAATIEARSRVLEDLSRLVGELSRQTSLNDERAREKLEGIQRWLEVTERGIRP